jgi:hypothetical protein
MNNYPPKIGAPSGDPLPPIAPRKKKGLPRIVVMLLIGLAAFFGFLGYGVVQFAKYRSEHPRALAPGEAEFREANRLIISASSGKIAHGNNRDGEALAATFSSGLSTLRHEFFTKGNEKAFSISKGEFLTYCQWNGDSCIFLVHVPELRRFDADAKKALAELAWMNAHGVVKTRKPPPKTVGLGIKGAVLYETIWLGDYQTEPPLAGEGVTKRGQSIVDLKIFYPYFAPTNGR